MTNRTAEPITADNFRRSPLRWALVGLAVGLLATVLGGLWHRDSLSDALRAEHRLLAERSVAALQRQLENCALLVRSVQTVFLASRLVTAEEFARVYDNIEPRRSFPSVVAVAYAERRVDPLDGSEHYITTLAAPAEGNEALLGLDVVQQRPNLEAVERARDLDEPVMSAPFRLIQMKDVPGGADGVVIRLPVYSLGDSPRTVDARRARHVGSLAVSFRVQTLIATALSMEALERFDVHVADVTGGGRSELFDSEVHQDHDADFNTLPTLRFPLHFGGREWELGMRPLRGAEDVGVQPWWTIAGGVVASLLLSGLLWSVTSTRARALALADRYSAQYRDSEARFRALNELLPALVLLARVEDHVPVYANQAARRRLGASIGERGTRGLGDIFGDAQLEQRLQNVARSGESLDGYPLELRGVDGQTFWGTLSVSSVELGGVRHLLAVANDITELHELNDRLSYQATHDALTDLYNRREFERRLESAIAQFDGAGVRAALLYVDLDQFKLINDTCGHYAGDQLLAQLSGVLHRGLRPQDVIARLGGDEFGILLVDVDSEEAVAAAGRVRNEVDDFEFSWEQRRFSLTASIGVVMIDRPGLSRREMLSLADTACYMAKERGRNRAHLFSEDDLETARRRTEMEWINRLREALVERRFELDYQEIEPLRPARQREGGIHIELLLRLRDEGGQRVPPGAFIPAAERFGLMPQIDRWVVETALAHFDRLHPTGPGLAVCAINLSANSVEDDGFADFVLDALTRYGVAAHRLCFEITETAAVGNMARVVRFMQRLRTVGCRFALDDFGAGMASFGYLKELPVDILKIDGSFIRNLETDAVNYSIVRAVTDIGHQVGLQVVAEWVGNERSRELLRGLGVDFAQGFAVHVPTPAPLFEAAAQVGQ